MQYSAVQCSAVFCASDGDGDSGCERRMLFASRRTHEIVGDEGFGREMGASVPSCPGIKWLPQAYTVLWPGSIHVEHVIYNLGEREGGTWCYQSAFVISVGRLLPSCVVSPWPFGPAALLPCLTAAVIRYRLLSAVAFQAVRREERS